MHVTQYYGWYSYSGEHNFVVLKFLFCAKQLYELVPFEPKSLTIITRVQVLVTSHATPLLNRTKLSVYVCVLIITQPQQCQLQKHHYHRTLESTNIYYIVAILAAKT